MMHHPIYTRVSIFCCATIIALGLLVASVSWPAAVAATAVSLVGTVVDWETHESISSVNVTVKCSTQTATTTTDKDGNFAFSSLDPDTCVVFVAKAGYRKVARSEQTVSLVPDQGQVVRLGLVRDTAGDLSPAPQPQSTSVVLPSAARPPSTARPPATALPSSSTAPPSVVAPPSSSPLPNYAVQHVYFATDRGLICECKPAVKFNGEQSEADALQYGEADVSIPRNHRMGGLENPSFWRLEFRPDAKKHIVVISSRLESSATFRDALHHRIALAPKHDAFVFIHGYNVRFEDAVRRTAQMAHDLAIAGPAIAFSWPAKGELIDYLHDETNIAWTTPHLEQFLKTLAHTPGISTIHIIAHSMGNRALAEALAHFGETNGRLVHVNDIVLAAPDIDDGRFREIADAFKKSVRHITIYASGSDRALQSSHKAHGYRRLGDVNPIPLVLPGFDVVDVTAVDTDWLGHGYFSTSTLMQDINGVFLGNEPPRFGLERKTTATGQAYWRFIRI